MDAPFEIYIVDSEGHSTRMNMDELLNDVEPVDYVQNNLTPSDDFDCLSSVAEQFSVKEKRVIVDMFGTQSADYRRDGTHSEIWNGIVQRMPKCTKQTVYRYLTEYDKSDMQEGDIITFDYSLTTTQRGRKFNDKSDKAGTIKYVIKCKPSRLTRAHLMESLWNPKFTALKGELQVNFENGTSFRVMRVHNARGIKYIRMQEL